MTTFSEHMAMRSLELAAELRSARARIRELETSRDLWRGRYQALRSDRLRPTVTVIRRIEPSRRAVALKYRSDSGRFAA